MKTGKKVLTLMLACAMVTSTAYMSYSVVDNATVSVSAVEKQTTSDGWEYTVNSNGTATITGYSKKSGDLIIPNTVDGKTVTEIGKQAFRNKTGYQNLTVPGTVKLIGVEAFSGCTGLRSIDIQNGVETIGKRAFSGCIGLNSINIQEGVKTIESIAFSDCTALTSVKLPDSVETIGSIDDYFSSDGVFYGCSKLTTVTLGKNLTTIGSGTFKKCTKLSTVEFAGQNIAEIGHSAFAETALENIVIPNKVKEIREHTFEYCKSLSSVTFPENLETIDETSFIGCSVLTNIKIPDKVTSIGSKAFEDCTSLENVQFGHSVEIIGDGAFANTKVKSIILPDGLKDIGDGFLVGIFEGCKELKTVVFQSSEDTEFTNIPSRMFKDCTNLTDVNILATVTTIESSAFANCTSLESIILPESVTVIENFAFGNCTSLKKIVIPESVTNITGGRWSSSFDGHSDELTIYGYTGTRAENYANEENIKFVALDGHIHESETYITEATCEDGGMKITRCKICGHLELEKTEYIAPKGHKNLTVTKEPTCTENGEKTGTCSDCGKTVTEIIPALGHSWSEWTVDPDNDKQEVRICANCGEKEYRDIDTPVLPTDPTPVPPTDPTPVPPTELPTFDPIPEPTPAPTQEPTTDPRPDGKVVDTGATAPLMAVFTLIASSVSVALLKKRRKNDTD